jgi:hypothetical protein
MLWVIPCPLESGIGHVGVCKEEDCRRQCLLSSASSSARDSQRQSPQALKLTERLCLESLSNGLALFRESWPVDALGLTVMSVGSWMSSTEGARCVWAGRPWLLEQLPPSNPNPSDRANDPLIFKMPHPNTSQGDKLPRHHASVSRPTPQLHATESSQSTLTLYRACRRIKH